MPNYSIMGDVLPTAGFSPSLAMIPRSPINVTASTPSKVPAPVNMPPSSAMTSIPLPDYSNAQSRAKYAQAFRQKYGSAMQGLGDTPLNVNEVPRGGSDTSKNLAIKYGKQYGIDPATLYAGAMVEGMSGLYKNKATGVDTKGRKPGEFGYQDYFGDKDFPINGGQSFGFVTMADRVPD